MAAKAELESEVTLEVIVVLKTKTVLKPKAERFEGAVVQSAELRSLVHWSLRL